VLQLGPYQLQLPAFWPEGAVDEKPGYVGTKAALAGGMTFELGVALGKGVATKERDRQLRAVLKEEDGAKHTRCDTTVMGATLDGHRFEGGPKRGADGVYEFYAGTAYGDLLLLRCSTEKAGSDFTTMRQLFFTMVGAALIRRGSAKGP